MRDVYGSDNPEGFGGWLIWFQMRLYTNIINLLLFSVDKVIAGIFIAMIVICLVLFYMRRLSFRIVYIIIIALVMLINCMALPGALVSLIVQGVVEGIIIVALFRSERVRCTFF